MLILNRCKDDRIVVGHGQQLWVTGPLGALVPIDPIEITVIEVRGRKARLGVEADDRVSVHRQELCARIDAEVAERETQRAAG